MEVVRGLAGKKTIILISHRLANVVESDQIYCLDKGQIVESGTHAEMMAKKGIYYGLYRGQQELEGYGGSR